jgi:hypothetical protein
MPNRKRDRKQAPKANHTPGDVAVPKWMITVPETPTPEELHDRREWVAALYPDDGIQKIVGAARVLKEVSATKLRDCLIEWGLQYNDRKNDRHERASFAPDRRQLDQIASYADKLEIALANLSDVSAISFWHPLHHVSMQTNPMGPQSHVTDFGLSIHKYKQDDGSLEIRYLRPPQIEEAVHVIRRLAEDAATSLPKQSGGQPQFGARLFWIHSARNFWRHYSSIAFDPRSTAFYFCFEALSRLDSSVTPQQVSSLMRAANKKPFPAKRNRSMPARTRTRTSKR